jgi:hypothetical protein
MESHPKLADRDNGPVQTMLQGQPKGPTYLGEQEHSPSTTWEQGGPRDAFYHLPILSPGG